MWVCGRRGFFGNWYLIFQRIWLWPMSTFPLSMGCMTSRSRSTPRLSSILRRQSPGCSYLSSVRLIFVKKPLFLEVLQEILGKIELQVPLAIENEEAAGRPSGVLPLGHVYGPADTSSLGWVLRRAVAGLYMVEDEAGYQAEYRRVLQLQVILSDHVCSVAKNNEFGGSLLVREIDRMITQIGVVIVEFVDEPAPLNEGGEEEMISGFTRFLAFYLATFREKSSIHGRRLEQCCDSLTYIGLRFLCSNRPVVLRHCIRCIDSMIESVCEASTPPNYFTLGDVFAFLTGILKVAVAQDQAEIMQEIERALSKPSNLTDDEWEQAQEAIQLRREQLLERLGQRDHLPRPENAETLLRELLNERRPTE